MRMSHIYQPIMLATLLRSGGICHEREIAMQILRHDESQIEYYTRITHNMVGQVLRKHKYVTRDRKSKNYSLVGYEELSEDEIRQLIDLCQQRLIKFLEVRGRTIFDHRRKSTGYISGTVKYEVLKKAKFHCDLCGISGDIKALEVDHIIPRNMGGLDDISNFQALCYSCNAMKQDKDDTDFHEIRESYEYRDSDCLFCRIDPDRVVRENELAYVIFDTFPVTDLHSLIITKRHVSSFFDLGQAEINAYTQLLQETREELTAQDSDITGFNIGMNDGVSAGQTIHHCHIHLIPRRDGDVDDPIGGVRNVIPGKGAY